MALQDSILTDLAAAAYMAYCYNTRGIEPLYSDAMNWAMHEVGGMNNEEVEEWMIHIFNDECDLIVHLDNDYNLGIALN